MPAPEVLELTARWVQYAREDIAAAEEMLRNRLPARLSCFHSQQAAEKALKAVLVLEQRDLPHTHDLVGLAEALPTSWSVTANPSELADLSRWAVQSRYPSLEESDPADAERALATARTVVQALARELEGRGVT